MQLAELSRRNFEAERGGGATIANTTANVNKLEGQAETMLNRFVGESQATAGSGYKPLKIPRRPEWTTGMTGEEVSRNENTAFLEWRRDIANVEEGSVNLAITPFEKNIEVWKQLWRVIEKSDLLL